MTCGIEGRGRLKEHVSLTPDGVVVMKIGKGRGE